MTLGESCFGETTIADDPAPRRFSMAVIFKMITIATVRFHASCRLRITCAIRQMPE